MRTRCRGAAGQHADEPVTARTTGHRHITHHMLFQRDVMADFHETVVGNWGGASLWDAVMRCWRFKGDSPGYCTGRFTEYEYCEDTPLLLSLSPSLSLSSPPPPFSSRLTLICG